MDHTMSIRIFHFVQDFSFRKHPSHSVARQIAQLGANIMVGSMYAGEVVGHKSSTYRAMLEA